jgi:hypothetical protein
MAQAKKMQFSFQFQNWKNYNNLVANCASQGKARLGEYYGGVAENEIMTVGIYAIAAAVLRS